MTAALACVDCGASLQGRGGCPKRCLPCAWKPRARLAAPGRVRHGAFAPKRLNGCFVCLDCSAPLRPASYANGRRVRPPLRCEPCGTRRYRALRAGRSRAAVMLNTALSRGQLLPATAYWCTDCHRPAEAYDHRDYTRPLDVDPVCRSCNVMRGPALVWPAGYRPDQPASREA